MNLRKNNGITLIALIITVIVLTIIAGITVGVPKNSTNSTEDATSLSELEMVQHAILENYSKSILTKETLPGTDIEISSVQKIIDEINSKTNGKIILKSDTGYKSLNKEDLLSLGLSKENLEETYIVNYNTGEAINSTKKVTNNKKPLYIY